MSAITQLWRMLRQKGDSPAMSDAKMATSEFRRVEDYSNRMLRDKEASDWLARPRPIDDDQFPERRPQA